MRDAKYFTSTEGYHLDLDFVNDDCVLLDEAGQTEDQRAAVASVINTGTIPGMPDKGVAWSMLYEQRNTMVDIDNQVRQNIDTFARTSGEFNSSYVPLYITAPDGQIYVNVFRGDVG